MPLHFLLCFSPHFSFYPFGNSTFFPLCILYAKIKLMFQEHNITLSVIVIYCGWDKKNAGVEFNISFRLVEDGSDIEIYILNQRQTKVALKRRLNEYNTDSIYMRSFEILLKTATTLYLHSLYPISPKCFFVCGFKQSRFFCRCTAVHQMD